VGRVHWAFRDVECVTSGIPYLNFILMLISGIMTGTDAEKRALHDRRATRGWSISRAWRELQHQSFHPWRLQRGGTLSQARPAGYTYLQWGL